MKGFGTLCNLETMKSRVLVCLAVLFSLKVPAQVKAFRSLTPPEKRWVIAHPFIAQKCQRLARQAAHFADSLARKGQLDSSPNGSSQDAFRHCCWMALLVQKIPAKKAKRLGEVHEAGNYWTFKHHQTEDGALPDSMATVMDLANNATGIAIGIRFRAAKQKTVSSDTLVKEVLLAVQQGTCVQLKRDASGNFTDCSGNALPEETWKGRWNIPKCLEPSSVKKN